MSNDSVCIVFLVDGRKIEAQACILAASIDRFFPTDVSRVAYHRIDYQPSEFVRNVLEQTNVELRTLSGTGPNDPWPWSRPWPVANKILALAEHRQCEITVAVDTDMFFRKYIDFEGLLGDGEVMAATADYMGGGLGLERPENWKDVYAHFGLDIPSVRRRLLAGRKLEVPPYYNGGFVAFREGEIGQKKEQFGLARYQDCMSVDRAGIFPEWKSLDQVVLPVTIERLGVNFKLAPETINYNVRAHGSKSYDSAELVHYHQFNTIFTHHLPFGYEALENMEAVLDSKFLTEFVTQYGDELDWHSPKNRLRQRLMNSDGETLNSPTKDLEYLADKFGTDKGSTRHRYTDLYQLILEPYRNTRCNFLEMGLQGGWRNFGGEVAERPTDDCPSIRMWLSYLKKAQIYGLDVSDFSWFYDPRFTFYRCDMEERSQIATAASILPQMDVIIDDASHASHHQQDAFLEFFPRLKSGGVYIIEDLRRQPPQLEREGITKTGDLLYNYQITREFLHSNTKTQRAFNKIKDLIATCFVFQVGYRKEMPHQIAVIQRR